MRYNPTTRMTVLALAYQKAGQDFNIMLINPKFNRPSNKIRHDPKTISVEITVFDPITLEPERVNPYIQPRTIAKSNIPLIPSNYPIP